MEPANAEHHSALQGGSVSETIFEFLNNFQRTYDFIKKHPLGSRHPIRAISNWAVWQIKSRFFPGPHEVPFIAHTRLMVSRGMHGATGNIYCGLHEFEDMAFVLHFLQPSDLFVDVGANIGSYTIIASGVCGAHSIAIEPIDITAEALTANIELNHLQKLVCQESSAIGDTPGTVRFSAELDCMNRVLGEEEQLSSIDVAQSTLDALLSGKRPSLIKIDVEGYEMPVLRGAANTLGNRELKAVIIEVNGSGVRYGSGNEEVFDCLGSYGFKHYTYNPFNRSLTLNDEPRATPPGNALFLRDDAVVEERVKIAPRHTILGEKI